MTEDDNLISLGREVRMHLTITLEDGTVALSTLDETPLEYRVGDGTLPKPIEQVLCGMHCGQRDRFTLTPEQAWGYASQDKIRKLPRDDFPQNLEPQPGQIIAFSLPNGEELPGAVLAIDEDRVEVDFNHPLAGHTVKIDVEILAIASRPTHPMGI